MFSQGILAFQWETNGVGAGVTALGPSPASVQVTSISGLRVLAIHRRIGPTNL